MSTIFTEADRLIIQNWDIVKEIHKAEDEVNLRLREYLFTFESQLAQCNWWDTMWKFTRYQNMQIYISHSAWKREDGYALWIGIENFSVEGLFGTDTYPSLYVWVLGERPQLVSALRRCLEDDESDIVGDIRTKGNNNYVVTHPLRKCLPEELDTFDEIIAPPILEFFSCYGRRAEALTEILESTNV